MRGGGKKWVTGGVRIFVTTNYLVFMSPGIFGFQGLSPDFFGGRALLKPFVL